MSIPAPFALEWKTQIQKRVILVIEQVISLYSIAIKWGGLYNESEKVQVLIHALILEKCSSCSYREKDGEVISNEESIRKTNDGKNQL